MGADYLKLHACGAESRTGSIIDSVFSATDYATEKKRGKTAMLNKDLLDILVCPKCKNSVVLTPTGDGLACEECKLLYEIQDDIPIMLVEEAKPLEK